MPTQADLDGARTAKLLTVKTVLRCAAFGGSGFSNRTIDALADYGFDSPEHVLFMSESDLKKIPGIGPQSMKELSAYRQRFIPART